MGEAGRAGLDLGLDWFWAWFVGVERFGCVVSVCCFNIASTEDLWMVLVDCIRFGFVVDPCLRSSCLDAWFLCAVFVALQLRLFGPYGITYLICP